MIVVNFRQLAKADCSAVVNGWWVATGGVVLNPALGVVLEIAVWTILAVSDSLDESQGAVSV